MNRLLLPGFFIFSFILLANLPRTTAQQLGPGDLAQTIGLVNVRENPSTSSATVQVLEDGTQVTVLDTVATGRVVTIDEVTSSVWYQVRLADDAVGYIWFGLLEPAEQPTATQASTRTPQPTATIPAGVLSTLDQFDIAADTGSIAYQTDEFVLDLSESDDEYTWQDIGGYERNFVLRAQIEWGPGPEADA